MTLCGVAYAKTEETEFIVPRPLRTKPPASGGFVVLVPLLVILTFALALLVTLQQRRAVQGRNVNQALEVRLNRELALELQRLQAAARQQGRTVQGRDLALQAFQNLLQRAVDYLAALEGQRTLLRRAARQATDPRQRRAAQQRIRRLDREIEVARHWILLIETREQQFRRAANARQPVRTPY